MTSSRRDLRAPERLRPPEVADARDEALVEERFADCGALVCSAQLDEHPVEVGRVGEDVRPESAHVALVQLEDRAVPQHRLVFRSAQDEPRRALASTVVSLHELPAPAHAEMAAQDEPALETEQEVLAHGLDAEKPTAVETLRDAGHSRARVWRLHLEPLADKGLERAGSAMERVAFGHAPSVCTYAGKGHGAGAVCRGRLGTARADRPAALSLGLLGCRVAGQGVYARSGVATAGFALHALNGAVFGLAFHEIARRVPRDPRRLALELALLEHLALFSTGRLVDRYHPARGEPGIPLRSGWHPARLRPGDAIRHTVFGFVLGEGLA